MIRPSAASLPENFVAILQRAIRVVLRTNIRDQRRRDKPISRCDSQIFRVISSDYRR
jgi:hypothetical protein